MVSIDNRIVKASFRECPISDRKQFKQSHCLLPISVGQSMHEDKKFLATINLINSSFQRCTILIDDTVQWHTLKIDNPKSSNEALYQMTLLEGSLWLKRNEGTIKNLNIPYDIMRWDQWHKHQDFETQFAKIEHLYNADIHYKTVIDLNIKDYLERYAARQGSEDFNYDHAFSCCLDYLKEECAVMTLWVEGLYDFEVYPSGRNKAMAATYERLIKPNNHNLIRPVALRFKKYPGPLTGTAEATTLISRIMHQPIFRYEDAVA